MKFLFVHTRLVLVNILLGFLDAFFLPLLLMMAFNRLKGPVNNPDGEMFVPFGWLFLLLIPIVFIAVNIWLIWRSKFSFVYWILSIAVFAAGAVAATIICMTQYPASYADLMVSNCPRILEYPHCNLI